MRRLYAAGLLTALLLGVPAAGPAAPAAAQEAPAEGGAVQEFAGCLTARGAGDVLVLLDQSASLRETDPGDVRVLAATYLLTQLEKTSRDVRAELDVAVAGFDRGYERTVAWQRLDEQSLPGVVDGVGAYRDRDGGFDTDYVLAIEGAQAELRDRQRAADRPRCQVLVWFSDGQFDVEVRQGADEVARFGADKPYAPGVALTSPAGTEQAEGRGRTALCRPGGVADQLRAGDVLTFAVGLGQDVDFALMRGAATGTGGQECGKPVEEPVGDFRRADDVEDLVFEMNRYAGLVEPVEETSGVCSREPCPAGTREFVLDTSIRSVDVLAATSAPGVDVLLSGPGGGRQERFAFERAGEAVERTLGGQQVRATWLTDAQLQLELARAPGDGWEGLWQVVFVDPDGAGPDTQVKTQIRITGDLLPRVVQAPTPLQAVEGARFVLGVGSEQTGEAVEVASVLGTARVSAALVSTSGATEVLAEGRDLEDVARGLTVDLREFPPGEAVLRLELAVQTRGTTRGGRPVPGTQLADRQVDLPVKVLPPAGVPVPDDRVDFGRTEGQGPHPAALGLTGPGCAWLAGTTPETGPEGVEVSVTSTASSPESCVRLEDGQRGELPLELRLGAAGNGTVSGLLDLRLAPAEGAQPPVATQVTYAGDVARPADVVRGLGAFLAALVLGLGLPLAFLYLVKHLTAKIPGRGLRVGAVPITVGGREVLRDGSPLALSLSDTRFQAVDPRGTRALQVEGLALRTRLGRSPTSAASVLVSTDAGAVVTSEGDASLPLGVHGSWVAVLQEPQCVQGRLVLLLPAEAGPDAYARIAREVRDRLPAHAQRLRERSGGPAEAPTPTGGWGGPPAPPAGGSGSWGAPPPPGGSRWGGSAPTSVRDPGPSGPGSAPSPPAPGPPAGQGWSVPPPPPPSG